MRCAAVDAGAAIVHNHNDDVGDRRAVARSRAGWHDPQPYIDAWGAAPEPAAGHDLSIPTQASGGPGTDIHVRLSHLAALEAAGVLGQGLIDPWLRRAGRRRCGWAAE